MKEEEKGFVYWVKAHKKELLIAGIGIGAGIAIILGIKNNDALLELCATLRRSFSNPSLPVKKEADVVPASPTSPVIEVEILPVIEGKETGRTIQYPFDVSEHIRNLHPGWKASAEKIAEAEMLGITLLPGQTLVDAYTKGGLVA